MLIDEQTKRVTKAFLEHLNKMIKKLIKYMDLDKCRQPGVAQDNLASLWLRRPILVYS